MRSRKVAVSFAAGKIAYAGLPVGAVANTVAAAFSAGRPAMGTVERDMLPADVAGYDGVWTEVSALLMAGGEFAGGSVGLADQPAE